MWTEFISLKIRGWQLNVNGGQQGHQMTSRKINYCHLFLLTGTSYKIAAKPESTIGKKVCYHSTSLCVLARPPFSPGTHSSQE
jgi:hypothetical protein